MTKRAKTELDKITEKLRERLSAETTNIWEIGRLLNSARQQLELEHGEWMPWLAQNFDLSYRTALRYMKVAEYHASKSATMANLSKLSPSVLYALAEGDYSEEEETAILDETMSWRGVHRIDIDKVNDIVAALGPPVPDLELEPELQTDEEAEAEDEADQEADAEVEAILDGPPPKLPPTEPAQPAGPSEPEAWPAFEMAIGELLGLHTKPLAWFAGTKYDSEDIETVACFLHELAAKLKTKAAA
jgi:hypothetical protein